MNVTDSAWQTSRKESTRMPERALYQDDLCREAQFTLRATDDRSGDGLTIDGVAAVFNTPTRIDSWEGQFDEQIAFGAFRKSISERMPKLQFDHGHHPLIGSLPIGRWDSMEEKRGSGLHAVGRLHDNWLVEPVRDAIREGSVDGMSFRFSVIREEWRDSSGQLLKDPREVMNLLWDGGDRGPLQRTLKEVKITEAGPVVWPAYVETSVGVRSRQVVIDLGRLTDPRERSKLAEAVFVADAATRNENSNEDAPPANQEPQPDEHPAEEITPAAPPVSEPSSGEHPSDPAIPVNPTDRAAVMRARLREVTDHFLAVSPSSYNSKESAT
jgi:HK97 family phage prohead protease